MMVEIVGVIEEMVGVIVKMVGVAWHGPLRLPQDLRGQAAVLQA